MTVSREDYETSVVFEKDGGIDSKWLRGVEDSEKSKLIARLTGYSDIWEKFEYIIAYLYRSKLKPLKVTEEVLWNEGYKQALIDVYNHIPRKDPTNDQRKQRLPRPIK